MQALILAGGLGTRLGSVVPGRPKALAPVCGRPFLDYQLAYLRHEEVGKVIVCIGHLGHQIISYLGDGRRFGLRVRYAQEHIQLGTGGAIRNALEKLQLDDLFLVLNGDTFLHWSRERLQSRHDSSGAAITIVLTHNPDPSTASVHLDASGIVTNYLEKPPPEESQGAAYASAGVYLVNRPVVERWPLAPLSLEHECLPRLVAEGRMYGMVSDSLMYDIGTPTGLHNFQQAVLSREIVCEFLSSR